MIETLRNLFADVLQQPMPEFTPATAFADVPGWDSVAHLALLLTIERHFNTAFTSAQMVQMQTVGDLLTALENCRG
jgi:acyl carrier protein